MFEPLREETKAEYLRIWMHYSVGHLNKKQLSDLFGCSSDKIGLAIRWSAINRIRFETDVLIEAAKESLESRLRELKNDLVRIKETTPINWNAYVGIHRLVKENEELLWRLQTVIQDKTIVNVNSTQINQVVKARDEALENLSDGEREELASTIRRIIGKQSDN